MIEIRFPNGTRLTVNEQTMETKSAPDYDLVHNTVHECVCKVLEYRGDNYENLLDSRAEAIEWMVHEATQDLLKIMQ